MKMTIEALFRNEEDDRYYVVHCKSDCKYDLERELEDLKFFNYKMVSCVITNNREVSLKARLDYCLKELRSLKDEIDYCGYDEVLINRVGLLTSRLLNKGVEITDEVALQCYDIRNQKIIQNS